MIDGSITLASALLIILLGVIVIYQSYRDATRRWFFGFCISLSLWQIAFWLSNIQSNWALFFNELTFAAPLVSEGFFVLFARQLYVSQIPQKSPRVPRSIVVSIGMAIFGAIFSFLPNGVVNSIYPALSNGVFTGYNVKHGPLYYFYVLAVVVTAVMMVRTVIKLGRSGNATAKRQAKLVAVGVISAVGFAVLTNIVLPVMLGSSQFSYLGSIAVLILVVVLSMAIARYKLIDVRLVVVRALAYLVSIFVVTFIFITPFVLFLNRLVHANLAASGIAAAVLFTVVFLYLVMYVRRYFDTATRRIFYRGYYDPQDVLDKLSDVLVRTADFAQLRENTAEVLKRVLNPEFLNYELLNENGSAKNKFADELYRYSQKQPGGAIDADSRLEDGELQQALREQNIVLAVKLRTTHEDLGFIVLGPKRSGESYSERDKKLLSIAADEIAISLQNALRFEQIQQFNVTLQEEVDTATRKLRQQNKRLEELDNIKDDFISMASHQLRTPLTSVKGYLSMVLEGDAGKLNDTQTQMLRQAFASSQRMVFLITDLLNVSRLKTGKFIIDAAPANLNEIVDQELQQLYETAQVKHIQLTYDRPATFPELMLDEVKIRQVIMNFVDNAIYYTPDGGHVTVELVEKPATVELRVIDDGIGVPKGEQHHLFTKFYRATNARKARPDGTGLGLFMAQKVILSEGGSIIFSSQENKGSTFGFALSKSKLAVPAKPGAGKTGTAKPAAKVSAK